MGNSSRGLGEEGEGKEEDDGEETDGKQQQRLGGGRWGKRGRQMGKAEERVIQTINGEDEHDGDDVS